MFKQPRVPEYRESEGVSKHLKALTLFLKDFCQDAWKAGVLTDKGLAGIQYPVTSVNAKTGDVVLEAADVKARPETWVPTAEEVKARPATWTPSAADVGALPSDGTAADASKLGGKTPDAYVQKSNVLDTLEEVTANTEAGMAAGALAVKELKTDMARTQIGVASVSVGSVAANYSCEINGVKFASLKITGISGNGGSSLTLCKLDTTFSSEIPVAISTNVNVKISAWIRSNGELAISPGGNISNIELRVIGVGW